MPADESPLSLDDLAGIDAACQAATPGPWQILADPAVACVWLNAASGADDSAIALFDYRTMAENQANARFAAAARVDVPRLTAEIRQLRARVQQLLDANTKEVDRRSQALRERDEALAESEKLRGERDAALAEGEKSRRAREAAREECERLRRELGTALARPPALSGTQG